MEARTISELSSDPLYNGDICDIDVGREGGREGGGLGRKGKRGLGFQATFNALFNAEGMKYTYTRPHSIHPLLCILCDPL